MKNDFKISILTIILSLAILGCGQGHINQKAQESSDSATKENTHITPSSDTEKAMATTQPYFDIAKFIEQANSLLTSIKGKPIQLTYKIDTITIDTNKYSPLRALIPSKALIKKYSFDPGKNHRELRFWLVDATYADKTTLENVFKELHHQSGKVNGPGLTYSNDYVIRSDTRLFWLNSLCPFSFGNHRKLSNSLLQSLNIEQIKDSIHCKCGQPVCGLQYP